MPKQQYQGTNTQSDKGTTSCPSTGDTDTENGSHGRIVRPYEGGKILENLITGRMDDLSD